MGKIKTLAELNVELSRLYRKLRPKVYRKHWLDEPEIRKQIDELRFKKYVEVAGGQDGKN